MDEADEAPADRPSRAARLLPILDWGRHYDRSWLRGDLIAGLAVAALVVPKSLGYAGIAGVPIQHGLYAAAAGTILYALFGTARQISTGPSSALAAVAGSAVSWPSVSGDEAVELVAAITLVTGLLFLLLAVFKMGWISLLLSKAVITGFLFGAAIEVVVGELPKITGTSIDGANAWRKFGNWIVRHGRHPWRNAARRRRALARSDRWHPLLADQGPGCARARRRWARCLGGARLRGSGIALVGDVPRGFVAPTMPCLDFVIANFATIGPAALGLLLIGFSQTAGDARAFAIEARIPNRHRSGVGGPERGEPRIGCAPGDPGLDQSVGEFAQR